MFNELKDFKKYKGKSPLITLKEVDDILKWKNVSSYAAVSNNGFLDAYEENAVIKFSENQVKALLKCDRGALMLYEGIDALNKNAEVFEKELELLENN